MAFWRLHTLVLASIFAISSLQVGIADTNYDACRVEMVTQEGFFKGVHHSPGKPGRIGGGELSFNITVTYKGKKVDCGKYVVWTDTFKEPNVKLPKETLDYLKPYDYYFPYYAIIMYNADSKLHLYLADTFQTSPPFVRAIWGVYNIPADAFYDGYHGQDTKNGTYVVYKYETPIYCLACRYVIQLHRQTKMIIDTPKTSTKRYPFNETQFEFEKTNYGLHRSGNKYPETMVSPINVLYFRIDLLNKDAQIDKLARDLEGKIIHLVEELKKTNITIDLIKEDEQFKMLMKQYDDLQMKVDGLTGGSPHKLKKGAENLANSVTVPGPVSVPKTPSVG